MGHPGAKLGHLGAQATRQKPQNGEKARPESNPVRPSAATILGHLGAIGPFWRRPAGIPKRNSCPGVGQGCSGVVWERLGLARGLEGNVSGGSGEVLGGVASKTMSSTDRGPTVLVTRQVVKEILSFGLVRAVRGSCGSVWASLEGWRGTFRAVLGRSWAGASKTMR